ncbi:MAG: hypothetical protein M3081_04390, partial [Gemmatimonadota bacterium]|nr:hypothetical protein [Gemmatimonadota bacterium]
MATLSQSERIVYVFTAAILGVAAMGTYIEGNIVGENAIVRGQPRALDDTIGVVLRFKKDTTLYLVFNRR